jgi:glutamate/tyrosine decarboxylase-like PLP-dependent enzyme
MQAHIRRHVKLGDIFHGLVKGRSDLYEVIGQPQFALTTFTLKAENGEDRDEVNRVTKEVYELVNKRGEIYITSSVVGGIYIIRVVSANEQAEEKYVRKAFDIITNTVEEVRSKNAAANSLKNADEVHEHHPLTLVESGGAKGLGDVTDVTDVTDMTDMTEANGNAE